MTEHTNQGSQPTSPQADHERVTESLGGSIAMRSDEVLDWSRRIHRFFHANPTAAPAIVLIAAVLAFSVIAGERFLTPFNLSLVLQQVTIIGALGVAQTLIIMTMGIDLSVGAIMVLSSVVMGRLAVDFGLPPSMALLLGLVCGAACGAINGTLVGIKKNKKQKKKLEKKKEKRK